MKEMPKGYEDACYNEKAIVRKRGINSPENLMILSLFHLLNGSSLTEVSIIAKAAKLGNVSDVAFMNRFEKCNDWFLWITRNLMTEGTIAYKKPMWLEPYNVIGVDASDVKEKGRSGRIYRLHFALDIFKMKSLQYSITTNETGETLRNFEVSKNDLYIGDRAYVSRSAVEYCTEGGGSFVFRLRRNSFKILDSRDVEVDLLGHLESIQGDETLDLPVYVTGSDGKKLPLRVCAKRKTAEAIAITQKKLRRREHKDQAKMKECTKTFNEYIVLITNLPGEIPPSDILELYRYRWQIELYFKRLKSIMDFGQLPKRRPESVFAWLNGKLMIALLIEKIAGSAVFSPDGNRSKEHMA
jgi:hypothetical protein